MVFGLDDDDHKKPAPKADVKKDDKKAEPTDSKSNEAQEMLKKMKEKNDAGDCAFC